MLRQTAFTDCSACANCW